MGPGATMDKRRPDLRDELGYIAPPNRKLPPVPGSNYNTCDRIKRGTVISKFYINIKYIRNFIVIKNEKKRKSLLECTKQISISILNCPLYFFYVIAS